MHKQLILNRTWTLGEHIDAGGFGQVFAVSSDGEEAVAKLVPKDPGADRELLFVNLENVRNVVPIIDNGEHDDFWVLVMPRAKKSLRQHLEESGPLSITEVIVVLKDICDALVELDGKIVHRDLKPDNVLWLGGHWCLADFGISRYAEATTAPDTHKFSKTPQYAAPEQWRNERATASTDIYAVGVIAYEMLAGTLPFAGPSVEQFRDQHLHADPPYLAEVRAALAALVEECLYKAPEARPSAVNLRARLDRIQEPSQLPGISRLEEANRAEIQRRAERARRISEAQTENERRNALTEAAQRKFERISTALRDAITSAAPSATASIERVNDGWVLRFNQAELRLSEISQHKRGAWGGWREPSFDVICMASLNLKIPANRMGYEGRSHSLWYGDLQEASHYDWFETAFMYSALLTYESTQNPFSLDPGEQTAKALGTSMAEFQVAWPFTPLIIGELEEFIDRWAGWLADAAEGRLSHPGSMPERETSGSWR